MVAKIFLSFRCGGQKPLRLHPASAVGPWQRRRPRRMTGGALRRRWLQTLEGLAAAALED
jgi:hypothetical protein